VKEPHQIKRWYSWQLMKKSQGNKSEPERLKQSTDIVRKKFRNTLDLGVAGLLKAKKHTTDKAKAAAQHVSNSANKTRTHLAESLAFLSQDNLLKWSERLTEGTASVYDKALDANYLKTHIGGGNHRMFDGGHSPLNAFDAARDALSDDTFTQETIGYISAIWKDVTTVKGLPFFTWDQASYRNCADWVTTHVPGANKDWFYDLCSYDVFEILGTALPIVGSVFALKSEDQKKVAEILGASGFVSIAAANPLCGIAMICVATYAYAIKRHQFDGKSFVKGAGFAGISLALFTVLGLPILIELIVVIVITQIIRKGLIESSSVQEYVKKRIIPALGNAKLTLKQASLAPQQQADKPR
jgi:hypothetical protein